MEKELSIEETPVSTTGENKETMASKEATKKQKETKPNLSIQKPSVLRVFPVPGWENFIGVPVIFNTVFKPRRRVKTVDDLYAVVARVPFDVTKSATWVSQLVVHQNVRQRGIATKLLRAARTFSNTYAYGLVSSSPYAVRALEKATRHRCNLTLIKENMDRLVRFGACIIPYISEKQERIANEHTAMINTEFYVDHALLDTMVKSVTAAGAPWKLGQLAEGWEWFAFTFQS